MIDLPARALLEDMLREANAALDAIAGLKPETASEHPVISRAVAMSLALIGEAANGLPEDFRLRNPDVAWNEARGLRNRIIHGYRTIVPEILIETVREDLPVLVAQLEALLQGKDPE